MDVISTGTKSRTAVVAVITGLAIVSLAVPVPTGWLTSAGQSDSVPGGMFVDMLLTAAMADSDDTQAEPLFPTAPCAPLRPSRVALGRWALIEAKHGGLIPISPYWDAETEAAWNGKVVAPRVAATEEEVEEDLPTRELILRSLPKKAPLDTELFVTETHENVTIASEKFVDSLSEPRFYPGVGPARQWKRHFKCTVQYERVRHYLWPIEHTTAESVKEVVYCDRDWLIKVAANGR